MSRRFHAIPIAGLLATMAVAIYMVVQWNAQGTAARAGDFSSATNAEVRDGQGQVVLRGEFALVEEDDDDTERKAPLEPPGSDTNALGEAEVEYSKATPGEQEIEFSARNLDAGATYTFAIDGTVIGTATADQKGAVEFDLDVKAPASQ